MNISVEQIINSNYIKYDRMKDIVNSAFVGSDAESLNIYVDLYSILKPIYQIDTATDNLLNYTISSCIINLCAHYREFFWTRYQVNTKFFLVYSENCHLMNKQFYPDYNKKTETLFNSNKLVSDAIKNNLEILNTMCPYLPDIFFIKGTVETGVIIYDLICRNELIDNNPHMVLTKDGYNYQLVPSRNNVIVVRPKKNLGEDLSYYINNTNLLDIYLQERKCKYRPNTFLMPGLLSLIMTLSSLQERGIKSLFNITTSLKMLEQAISGNKILNGYNSDTKYIFNSLYNDKFNVGLTTFEFRFKATDIAFQHSVYMNTPECKSIILNNLEDPETVKEINNKYFRSNPLDLNRL